MDFKTIISSDRRFKLIIPANWDEYDDGDDGNYAFFNSTSPVWTGNLRITHFIWKLPEASQADKGAEFVDSELKENPGAEKVQIGNFEAARYCKNTIGSDNDPLIIWYWAFGARKDLFLCTFTAPDIENPAKLRPAEFETVEQILISLELIN